MGQTDLSANMDCSRPLFLCHYSLYCSFRQAWTDYRMWSCCMDYCEPDHSPDVIWLIQLYSHLHAFCIHFHLISTCFFLFQIRYPNVLCSQHKPPGETVLERIMWCKKWADLNLNSNISLKLLSSVARIKCWQSVFLQPTEIHMYVSLDMWYMDNCTKHVVSSSNYIFIKWLLFSGGVGSNKAAQPMTSAFRTFLSTNHWIFLNRNLNG